MFYPLCTECRIYDSMYSVLKAMLSIHLWSELIVQCTQYRTMLYDFRWSWIKVSGLRVGLTLSAVFFFLRNSEVGIEVIPIVLAMICGQIGSVVGL